MQGTPPALLRGRVDTQATGAAGIVIGIYYIINPPHHV